MDSLKLIHLITDETRFRLIELLLKRSYCVKALSKKIGISEPAVSQQMKILKQNGLVKSVKIGYQVHYNVERNLILSAIGELSQVISHQPTAANLISDADCSCEFEAECRKREAKIQEMQRNDR